MNSKAIKRQLLAAIAMVLVAAVALGSSTYAWFVSNNKVTATTASISAQSNAPFLKIDLTTIAKTSGTSATRATEGTTALYPAQVVYTGTPESPVVKWYSAYSDKASDATEASGTRFEVGDHTVALTNKYALKQSFVIGTDADTNGSFKNLVVDEISIVLPENAQADKYQITSALRVLLVCGNNHYVYAPSTSSSTTTWAPVDKYADNIIATGNTAAVNSKYVLKDTIPSKGTENATVDIYLFYDGSQTVVNSKNLVNLGSASVTVSFSAEAFDPNAQGVTAPATQVPNGEAPGYTA